MIEVTPFPDCPICGKQVSPLASYVVVEDQATGERLDAHVRCTEGLPVDLD